MPRARFTHLLTHLPIGLTLFALTVLAAWVRWYPGAEIHFTHPDEPIVVFVVDHMRTAHTWDTNWNDANLPATFKYPQYNFSGYHVIASLWAGTIQNLAGQQIWISILSVQWYRWLSAILGTLCVLLTGLLAHRFGRWPAAILAASLTAFNIQLVQDGHYGRPEALLTALTLLCAWIVLRRDANRWPDVLLTAFLTGFAFSIKVTALACLVFPLTAVLSLPGEAWKTKAPWLLAILPPFILGAYLGMPGAFAHPDVYRYGLSQLQNQYLQDPHAQNPYGPIWKLTADYYLQTLWPLTISLVLAGTYFVVRRKQWRLALTMVLPFWLTYLYFSHAIIFFERNLSHVLPFAFILAGLALNELLTLLPQRRPLRPAAVAIAVALCIWPSAVMTSRFIIHDLTGKFLEEDKRIRLTVYSKRPKAQGLTTTLTRANEGWWNYLDKTVARTPLLLRVTDFHDLGSTMNLGELRRRYVTEDGGTLPSLYQVPYCTLTVYHSPTIRYIWVLRKR